MKILVLVKQVPDTTEVRLREDLTLERDFIARVMNPADESALEWALETRDRMGGSVTVMSMGPPRAETTLREALSRGADEAVLLTDPRFAGADTLATAKCLAAAYRHLDGFDVVACGRRAVDGETGQVGPMTAALLSIPCVTNITSAEAAEALTARQLTEDGVKVIKCAFPALITFCEWSLRLRLLTLTGLKKAQKAGVTVLTPDSLSLPASECGLKGSPTRVVKVDARPVGVRPCRKVSVQEAMEALERICPEVLP